MKVIDLKGKLTEYELTLSTKGNKPELLKRLQDHFYAADEEEEADTRIRITIVISK